MTFGGSNKTETLDSCIAERSTVTAGVAVGPLADDGCSGLDHESALRQQAHLQRWLAVSQGPDLPPMPFKSQSI